jgi:hypothetical protein
MSINVAAHDPSGPSGHLPREAGEEAIPNARPG